MAKTFYRRISSPLQVFSDSIRCRRVIIGKWPCLVAISLFMLLFLFAVSSTADANTPIVPVFACLLPLWTSILTMGLSFIVISAVEGAAMHYMAKLEWWRSMWVSFLANFASTLIGAVWYQPLATATAGLMFLSIFLIIIAWRVPWYLAIVGGGPAFASIPSFGFAIVDYNRIYWFLLPAFLLTLAVEGPFWLRMMPLKKALTTTLATNLISYALLVVFLLLIGVRAEDDPGLSINNYTANARYAARDGDAKGCLEALEEAHRVALRPRFGRWFRDSISSELQIKWAGRWGEAAEWAVEPFIDIKRQEDALMVLRKVQTFTGLNETDKKDLAKAIGKCDEGLRSGKNSNGKSN
jgi:hypothetical protein